MNDLQCKMLAALERLQLEPGCWRDRSRFILRGIIEDWPTASPVQLRRLIRARCPCQQRRGFAYRSWCWVVRYAIDEATGLASLQRRRRQDAEAVLFNGGAS